jgi:hypothetical protein
MMKPKSRISPGLELDKLIAEKVLGWYQDSDVGGPRAWWYEMEGADEIMATPGPYPRDKAMHLNHFSTDIKAAWDLVEKFKLCLIPWGGQWVATKRESIFIDGEENIAPTAPHAICLAALLYAANDKGERTMTPKICNGCEHLKYYMHQSPDKVTFKNSCSLGGKELGTTTNGEKVKTPEWCSKYD